MIFHDSSSFFLTTFFTIILSSPPKSFLPPFSLTSFLPPSRPPFSLPSYLPSSLFHYLFHYLLHNLFYNVIFMYHIPVTFVLKAWGLIIQHVQSASVAVTLIPPHEASPEHIDIQIQFISFYIILFYIDIEWSMT